MTSGSKLFDPMLLPRISSPENIVRSTQEPVLYIIAFIQSATQPQAAEMSAQPDLGPNQHKNEIRQPTEVPDGVPSRSELHSLHVHDLNHIGVTPMEKAIM